jgi:hypothetical protein
MVLRIISIILLFLVINGPSYGYHLSMKGNIKSSLPSCGMNIFPGMIIDLYYNRIYERGCHGMYTEKGGRVYKGEMQSPIYTNRVYLAGKGILKYPSGVTYVGEFRRNSFVLGVKYINGVKSGEGRWRNGKLTSSFKTSYSPKGSSVSQASLSPLKKSFQSLNSYRRKKIQESLSSEGLYNSTIDGLYGRGTEKALKEYNKKYLSNSDLKKKDNVSALLAKLEEQKAPKPKVETKKEVVTTSTDTKQINTEWQLLAEEGSAMAQYKLASMYEKGEGLLKDFVYAHMWANLSATNGYAEAKDLRDALEKKMTASQMEKAQDLARECMRKKYKGC